MAMRRVRTTRVAMNGFTSKQGRGRGGETPPFPPHNPSFLRMGFMSSLVSSSPSSCSLSPSFILGDRKRKCSLAGSLLVGTRKEGGSKEEEREREAGGGGGTAMMRWQGRG